MGTKDKGEVKDVYSFYQYNYNIAKNATGYTQNNWMLDKLFTTTPLPLIHGRGAAIWLTANGIIKYRRAPQGKILTGTIDQASMVLSNVLGYAIEIRKKPKVIKESTVQLTTSGVQPRTLLITDLLLVQEDRFDPTQVYEFYTFNDIIYRNDFSPTLYYTTPTSSKQKNFDSITLQYIYYLSDYKVEKFEYLMNWLASFFKNLSDRSNVPIVLYGEKESGKDLLYEAIIKPLFGDHNCIELNDRLLERYDPLKLIKNKLFYHLHNISSISMKNRHINDLMHDLVDNKIMVETKESVEEYRFYGQILITIDKPEIPYIDRESQDFTMYKVPENIEDMYIPDWWEDGYSTSEKMTKYRLLSAIKFDLDNFAFMLKSYPATLITASINDDKECLITESSEDGIQSFATAIITANKSYFDSVKVSCPLLHKELLEDFDNKKVKQPNLMKIFKCIDPKYDGSSKALMIELRKLDSDFFSKEKVKPGPGGVKYFEIQ